jgi:hypothetical protein
MKVELTQAEVKTILGGLHRERTTMVRYCDYAPGAAYLDPEARKEIELIDELINKLNNEQ